MWGCSSRVSTGRGFLPGSITRLLVLYQEKAHTLTSSTPPPSLVTAFTSWVQIMMGRFISGWGVGGLSAAVPVYQAESVPKQVRGACTSTYQLAITLGSKYGVWARFTPRGKEK